jgi:pyruvate,water dikinase
MAGAYRASRSIGQDSGMAVVVQRMVPARWAGVCFTADPTAQALSAIVINATAGLGEIVVSGDVNPEEIQVKSATGEIIQRRTPSGIEPLPEKWLQLLVQRSKQIADAFGFPQDIEWAVDDDDLVFLQTRPITTIASVWYNRALEPWAQNPDADPDNSDRIWSRVYADEIWAPPVSPLFYDVQNLTGEFPMQLGRYGDRKPCPADTFKYYRAAPYVDISVLERVFAYRPRLARLRSLLNQLPSTRREHASAAPWKWWGLIHRTWIFEVKYGPRWGFTRNHRFLKAAWAPFLVEAKALARVDETALDDEVLGQHLSSIWALAETIGVECGITVFYYAQDLKLLLTALLDRWFGNGEALYASVSAGRTDSHTLSEAEEIYRIADLIRQEGSECASASRNLSWLQFARLQPAYAKVVLAVEALLRISPHRGANYKDLIYPRWGDDPELLWRQVTAFVDVDGESPTELHDQSVAACRRTQRECIGDLRGITAPVRRALLKAMFRYDEIYMGLRDNHRYYYDWIWWMLRCVYLEMGRRLHARLLLQQPDDVFFLVRSEILELSVGQLPLETAAVRIDSRKLDWQATKKEQPPKFLKAGYVPFAELTDETQKNRLHGLAASAGRVVGRARIIRDVSELDRLRPHDILVTRQTDPSWTPAFARLRGLVLETGGVLAHGASLCREFNVPCVTSIENATIRIDDGAEIAVDGGLGIVEILAPVETGL